MKTSQFHIIMCLLTVLLGKHASSELFQWLFCGLAIIYLVAAVVAILREP